MATRVRYKHIAPELEQLAVPIDRVRPHPLNPRIHDVDTIAASIKMHGQSTPISVQASTSLIVKGNGTYEAMMELGCSHIAAVFKDCADEQALAYLLDDNHGSDNARWDISHQLELLEDLDLSVTTYTENDLALIRTKINRLGSSRLGADEEDREASAALKRWRTVGGRARDELENLHGLAFKGVDVARGHCSACNAIVDLERLLGSADE